MGDPRGLGAAAAFGLPAVLLSLAAAGPGVLPGDVAVERGVEALPGSWVDHAFRATNAAGAGWVGFTVLTVILLVPLLKVRALRAAVLLAAASFLRLAVFPLKALVASPRPTPDLVQVVETQTDYGFPSGHAFGATVLFGALWLAAPSLVQNRAIRAALRTVALLAIVVTAVARIRVGAHWPSDVLGGVLWGSTALAVLVAATGPLTRPWAPTDRDRKEVSDAVATR